MATITKREFKVYTNDIKRKKSKDRIVSGFATTSDMDRDNEVITEQAIK